MVIFQLVAPFSGVATRSENENEIILSDIGELPVGSEIVITNVEPNAEIMHPDDALYDVKKASFLT